MDQIVEVVRWCWDNPIPTGAVLSLLTNTVVQWTPWKQDDDLIKAIGKILLRKG